MNKKRPISRRTPFYRSPLAQGISFLIVGGLLGGSVSTFRIGKEWDRVILDNAALIDEVERLAGELASRERALARDQAIPVRSIEIEIDGTLPEQIRLVVESEVRDMLHHLLGEDVDSLHPAFIEKSLDRTIKVANRELTVTPVQMRLGSKILVRLKVTEGGVQVNH